MWITDQTPDVGTAAEGGADDWARPALSPVNEKKDKLSATSNLYATIRE
jgi:hypothetical protein